MKILITILSFGLVFGQSPDTKSTQQLLYYSSTNLIYLCEALAVQPNRALVVSSITNATPAVITFTAAHNIGDYTNLGATVNGIIKITNSPAGWTGLNGTFIAIVASATTLSVAVDSTSFGTLDTVPTVTTTAPSNAFGIWSIRKFFYDGSNNLITSAWLAVQGQNTIASSKSYDKACASRASYGAQ